MKKALLFAILAVALGYWIPTLPAGNYSVRVFKWGYNTPQRSLAITEIEQNFVLKRISSC